MRFFLLLVFSIVFLLSPAQAKEGAVLQCGVPEDPQLETQPAYDFCNIYARQMAYRDNRNAFRAQLDKRREAYEAPGRRARQAYEARVQSQFR